jgi:hypothetical protein
MNLAWLPAPLLGSESFPDVLSWLEQAALQDTGGAAAQLVLSSVERYFYKIAERLRLQDASDAAMTLHLAPAVIQKIVDQ